MRLPCGTPQVTAHEPDSSPLTTHFFDDRLDSRLHGYTPVYPCIPMYTHVCPCIHMYTLEYPCIPLYTLYIHG